MDVAGRKILVAGAGRSGVSSARFLAARGAAVTLNDAKAAAGMAEIESALSPLGVTCVWGGHPQEVVLSSDLIVVSPGVPVYEEPFATAIARGIPVIGELELGARFTTTPIIAIGGTNGKTTTTTLLGELFKDHAVRTFVGGNIGIPLVEYAERNDCEIAVVEVSSFQMETVASFHPHGALLLNVTPDHLDRYPSMREYAEAKMRMFENQRSDDFAVLNADDEWVGRYRGSVLADVLSFSSRSVAGPGAFFKDGTITFTHPAADGVTLPASEIRLAGLHNMENVMAASLAALEMGVPFDSIRATLARFEGLPHRLELVDTIDGVRFYNDSKGTNVGAAQKALEGFDVPVVLIMGGKDKGTGYDFLAAEVERSVRSIVAIGEARKRIAADLGAIRPVTEAATLQDAVREAFRQAVKGDVVMLSPACSSFDMFTGYAQRGEVYRAAVRALAEDVRGTR